MSFSAKQLYHWKELEKLVKKGVSFFMFRFVVLEIMRIENCPKQLIRRFYRRICSFSQFSDLIISRTIHRNVKNETPFLTSFSSSFQWYNCFVEKLIRKKEENVHLHFLLLHFHFLEKIFPN